MLKYLKLKFCICCSWLWNVICFRNILETNVEIFKTKILHLLFMAVKRGLLSKYSGNKC